MAVTILQQDTTMLKKTDEPAIIFEDIGDQGSTSSSGIPETLIQVEVDGKTRGLATTTRERKNIIEEIVDALGGEEPIVEQTLTNEPAQDLKEQDDIPVRFREDTVDLNVPRVKEGLTAAIEFLTSVSQEFDRDGNEAAQKAFEEVINTLNLEISQVPSEVIVEAVEPVHDNKKMATSSVEKEYSEQESTTDIRIQIKEGKVELYRPLIESQIIPEQNNAPVSLDTDVPQIVAAEKEELPEKIRVEIEDDRAKVSFEMNDTKHKAFFPYTNTEALIAGIAAAYDLSEEVIKAVIDIQ